MRHQSTLMSVNGLYSPYYFLPHHIIMPNILPENAPFSPLQRAWLDGFFSSALGINGVAHIPIRANGNTTHTNGTATPPKVLYAPQEPPVERPKATVLYNRDNPFPARVVQVTPLNGEDSEKDVRSVILDLGGSGLTYEVGDALGIYPENRADLVEDILEALGATGEEPVVTPESRIVPMRIALTLAYDITRVSEDFLMLLAETAGDEEEAKRLQELAEADAEDWLMGRDVLDVLHHFRSIHAAPSEIVASLSPLQPRLYSIASSQKAYPDQVHLTVGVVRYEANNRLRNGVASTFLADFVNLKPGQKVSIFVHPAPGFRLPEDGNVPVIMVGPGTGIAPFRAFLQERRAKGATGKNWLFFGDQHEHCDFLYREELDAHLSDGSLVRLDTAFSRDQAEKIYVQNRMLQYAAEIWNWLEEDGHFYVCGDAKRMAKDVDNALQQIVAEQGKMSAGAAKEYVQGLVKAQRYQRDVY
jgi:sulfite reductase (NADPH) flavoprotein alpha-component